MMYHLLTALVVCSRAMKFISEENEAFGHFGRSVAFDGNYLVIGAENEDHRTDVNTYLVDHGSAYVYQDEGDGWQFVQELLNTNDFDDNDNHYNSYGYAVSIFYPLIVVGAYQAERTADDDVDKTGRIYAWEYNSDDGQFNMIERAATEPDVNDFFGFSAAIYEDVVAIGSFGDDLFDSGYDDDYDQDSAKRSDVGSVVVFRYTSGDINEEDKASLKANSRAFDFFGYSVGLTSVDDTILMAAGIPNRDTGSLLNHGAVAILSEDGDNDFNMEYMITANDKSANDFFGRSLSVSEDILVVGSVGDDLTSGVDAGSAYVFQITSSVEGGYKQLAKLWASDGAAADHFGFAVSIHGDVIVIGAKDDDVMSKKNMGSAYVFRETGSTYTQKTKLTALDGAANDQFGSSVFMYEDTLFIGAPYKDGVKKDEGAVYAYVEESATKWVMDCPAGTYTSGLDCLDCAVNTFSDSRGQSECHDCPSGTATGGMEGSNSIDDCITTVAPTMSPSHSATLNPTISTCRGGFWYYDGMCYGVTSVASSMETAEATCASWDGWLVQFNSLAMYNTVRTSLIEWEEIVASTRFWVGAGRAFGSTTFTWTSDGPWQGEEVNSALWSASNPNFSGYCVQGGYGTSWLLDDSKCSNLRIGVCQANTQGGR